jgi:two-component system OmpR family sensor kinase
MRRRLTLFYAHLSIRLRVTLAFTAVMLVLLGATGLFLYLRLGNALDDTLDRGLAGRADDITALLRRDDTEAPNRLAGSGERIVQLVDGGGRVVDAAAGLGGRALLPSRQLTNARRHELFASRSDPTSRDVVRLLARPIRVGARSYVLIIGASREPNESAQHRLGGLLLIGLPVALLLAALVGYGAATAALRPVELMRRRATTITAGRPERLPVPPSGDEIAALGRTLNDMLDRLEQAYARERRFVADASHELRTPLTILRGELELAMRDAVSVGDYRAAVASAAEETERLVRLAQDLLVVAQADQGRLPVRREQLGVQELLDSVAARFAGPARDAQIVLSVDAGADLRLDADRTLIEQALGNLVDNALRHATHAVQLGATNAELYVRDDGPGFETGFLTQAFDRFARADSGRARDSGGAGLGMAIVAAIATAHGGRAVARNRPEGGAEVALNLTLFSS